MLEGFIFSTRADLRKYRGSYNYAESVTELWSYMDFNYPGCVQGLFPRNIAQTFSVGDFWVAGDGGHGMLGLQYDLKLPSDYLEFSLNFQHYALVTRNCIHLWNAKEVNALTAGLRDGENIPKSTPHRLYRFARNFSDPAHFMFRWNEDGSFRDIAYASYSDFTETDILGEESERFSCDKDFSAWLERMIKTDGAPLHPGFSHEEDFFIERIL